MMNGTIRNEVRNMTNADLNELVQLVNVRRTAINATAALMMRIGDRVQFEGKRGRMVSGIVSAIKRGGKIEIDKCSDGLRWRCGAGHVTVIPPKAA